jgi:hypothetical protein
MCSVPMAARASSMDDVLTVSLPGLVEALGSAANANQGRLTR